MLNRFLAWLGVSKPRLSKDRFDQIMGYAGGVVRGEIEQASEAFAIDATEEEIPLGSSKLGGRPDLPPDIEWPAPDGKPLAFLAQVNLGQHSSLRTYGSERVEGLVYIFSDPKVSWSHVEWGNPKMWQVIRAEPPIGELRRTDFPRSLGRTMRFRSLRLQFDLAHRDTECDLPLGFNLSSCSMEQLAEIFRKNDLDHVADDLNRVVANCIRLRTRPIDESDCLPGSSRIGGRPDFPPEMEWPEHDGMPMSFFAQIDLADVSQFDTDAILPTRGILYFFCDPLILTGPFEPDEGDRWRMFIVEGESREFKQADFPKSVSNKPFHAATA